MKVIVFILLLFSFVFCQEKYTLAIIQTETRVKSFTQNELVHLTDLIRERAFIVLSNNYYDIMTPETALFRIGSVNKTVKLFNKSTSKPDLGKKLNANYIAGAVVSSYGEKFNLELKIYETKKGNLIGQGVITGSKNGIENVISNFDNVFKKLPLPTKKTYIDKKLQYSFTDPRDGQVYPVVHIGSQTWMARNMNYAGTKDFVVGECPKNLDYKECQTMFGRLYYHDEKFKVCPPGWRLPNSTDIGILVDFANDDPRCHQTKYCSNAGTNLKSKNLIPITVSYEVDKRGNSIRVESEDLNGKDLYGFNARIYPRTRNFTKGINPGAMWQHERIVVCDMPVYQTEVVCETDNNIYLQLPIRCIKD